LQSAFLDVKVVHLCPPNFFIRSPISQQFHACHLPYRAMREEATDNHG
jgi:hypothetical protein